MNAERIAELRFLASENVLTEELREQARQWETGTGEEDADLIIDRLACELTESLDVIERLLAALLKPHYRPSFSLGESHPSGRQIDCGCGLHLLWLRPGEVLTAGDVTVLTERLEAHHAALLDGTP